MENQPMPTHTEEHMRSIAMWDPTPLGRYAYTQLLKTEALEQNIEDLEKQVNQDPLTKLPNRGAINPYFDKEVDRLNRHNTKYDTKQGMSLYLLDLNGFKSVNDTLGHAAGDKLLVDVSTSLSKLIREYDIVVRLGGDEFVIVLTGIEDSEDGSNRKSTIINTVSRQVMSENGDSIEIGTAIGEARFSSEEVAKLATMTTEKRRDEIATKQLEADEKMYRNKRGVKSPAASLPATFDTDFTPDQPIEQQVTEISSQGRTIK